MQPSLLSPKIDFVFKKIFGSQEHPRILISFLNAVLKPIVPIVEVEIKNSDIEKEHIKDKISRLDVKATTSNREIINIEIREAKDELYRLSRSSKERELYFMRSKSLKDEMSALANAEEKGREEGREEGEKNKAIEIAKSLLDVLEVETISLKTGLSIEEINKLK